jgi:arachidonate 15-lipoxygenase
MGLNDDLNAAITQGRVYLADYGALDWLVDGGRLTYQKYLWAPIAMFAVRKGAGSDRHLRAVGIQTGQYPSPSNPIILRPPSGSSSLGRDKAKTALQIAQGNYYEAVSHWDKPIWFSKRLSWRHRTGCPGTPSRSCCSRISKERCL